MKDLRRSYEASVGQLRERQRQLEVAQVENQLLKMKVKCGGADSPRPFSSFPFLLSPPIFSNSSPFLCFPSWRRPPFCGQLCRACLRAPRGFLCSLLSVQIGGPHECPQRALLPWPQWPQGLPRPSSWRCCHILRGHCGAHRSGTSEASLFRFSLTSQGLCVRGENKELGSTREEDPWVTKDLGSVPLVLQAVPVPQRGFSCLGGVRAPPRM